jgi:translation initiation factor 5
MNIRGLQDNLDPFYRYEMAVPNLEGNRLTNLSQISKDLGRDPVLIVAFFKAKFNAACTVKGGVMVLPKMVTKQTLVEALYEFIEVFVLCPQCRLPETVLEGRNLDCKACGCTRQVDTRASKAAGKIF